MFREWRQKLTPQTKIPSTTKILQKKQFQSQAHCDGEARSVLSHYESRFHANMVKVPTQIIQPSVMQATLTNGLVGNKKDAQTQFQPSSEPAENHTGMSDQLKSGLEQLSGFDLSDVRVHYNSAKPAQLKALAYAKGQEIYLGPGQERQLPHESWHVVQQMQGRVKTTCTAEGALINTDAGLEYEADVMGLKALQRSAAIDKRGRKVRNSCSNYVTIQRLKRKDIETFTENENYMTLKKDKSVLLGKKNATPPVPVGLYTQREETLQQKKVAIKLSRWDPNVRLFSMEERFGQEKENNQAKDYRKKHATLSADWDLSKAMQDDTGAATMGIAGPNDCLIFARALRAIISEKGEKLTKKQVSSTMFAQYNPQWEKCDYHAATEVARDGESRITLEAHASKKIKKPYFHIYDGIEGFAKENTPPKKSKARKTKHGEIRVGKGAIPLGEQQADEPNKLRQTYSEWYKDLRNTRMGLKEDPKRLVNDQ